MRVTSVMRCGRESGSRCKHRALIGAVVCEVFTLWQCVGCGEIGPGDGLWGMVGPHTGRGESQCHRMR